MKKNITLLFTCLLLAFITTIKAFSQPVLTKAIPPDSKNFTTSEGRLFFTSHDSLWTSTGTAASTYFIKKTGETFLKFTNLRLGSFIYFTTLQSDGKTALWRTNGTGANTMKIAAYPDISPEVVYNGNLYLSINDGVHGYELWKLNLSNSLTMVKDIVPGASSGLYGNVIVSSGMLFFLANGGTTNRNLYKSDGTSSGTVQVSSLPSTSVPAYYTNLVDVNGIIFFTRNYLTTENAKAFDLWKSDGTGPGTQLLKVYYDTEANNLYERPLAYHNKLYFLRSQNDSKYYTLVTSDGTISGTNTVKYLNTDIIVKFFGIANDYLVFTSIGNNNFEDPLLKSDGTAAGTSNFYSFDMGTEPFRVRVASADKLLFFTDDIELSHQELYQTDTHTENTRSLVQLFGTSFKESDNLTPAGENLYFTTKVPYSTNPEERKLRLWFYDPTKPSTNKAYFSLINTNTNEQTQWLKDGDYIFKSAEHGFNIGYNPASSIGSVQFKLNGSVYRTESIAPYAVGGDVSGIFNPWNINPGSYELTATPYSGSNATGLAGTPTTIHFTVVAPGSGTRIGTSEELTADQTLMNAFPNPSSGDVFFTVDNPETGKVKAEILKADGTLLETVLETNVQADESVNFSWSGDKHPAGIYLCRYTSGTKQVIRKIVLNK